MKYIKIVIILIMGIFVYVNAMRIIRKDNYPTILGFGNAIVVSGSMEPTISVNDLVITKKQTTYESQDIVLFHTPNALVTHRIVDVKENTYLTQGDANNTVDSWLSAELIEGKVVLIIPSIGIIQEFFSTDLGRFGLFLIIISLILVIFEEKEQNPCKKIDEYSN